MKSFPKIEKEEEYWFSLKDLQEYDLSTIPEKLDIIIDNGIQENENFPVTQLNKVGNELKLNVSKMLMPEEFWKHKYSALQFAEAIVKGINNLNENSFQISNVEFDDGGAENGICIWWTLTLPLNSSISQIEKSIVKSVEIAFNQGLNYLEGLSSVLILGKDTDEYLERLKMIATIVEKFGYNPIIIKEKDDILGETVIQKVLRYGLQSKFIIIENTEASGHLYEIPHLVKMAEKITIVLQEEGKGSTWMIEDMYYTLRTAKKYKYIPVSIEDTVKESIVWANETFNQLCDYQTKELPWLKK